MDRSNHSVLRGRPVSTLNAAKANEAFEYFISAGTLKTILGSYQNLCELLHLKPNVFPLFYPKLKANLNSWKPKAVWKKIDARASHKCYARGKACPNTRVLIIGAGPCGLRTAIEAQLLGAKVVVIEKRDRMSRNNVLHLWPFVIEDLRNLGAKKFFGKFCAGAIDHISIRQLQCILFKVALLLGVEIHTEVSFERLIEPSSEKTGWRAEFKPADHPVAQYEFDVVIGADGKRNTLQGFKRKEFRGKLAIAITANFINKRTEAEARVEEISGVAFIFNQKFFKELNANTGIDLENIVYYKDDTHYFVMTAKKHSLIDKGVIIQDYADTARLLSPDNVDREALLSYAREAADFSTNYQMPDLEFAVNHYGQPDVAMFDFTSMYAAENASKFVERNGYKLLMILVGDSLLEPFWPTGSGCARGFLSSLDASWAIKAWGSGLVTPLEVLAERESIYRLLAQTTPENLNKDCKSYALDPSTRYPNLNKALLLPQQVLSLYDTDDPSKIELTPRIPLPTNNSIEHRKRRRRDNHLDPNTLLSWIKDQVKDYTDLEVENLTTSLRDGRVLCAIIHHYRPDLLDYSAIKADEVSKNNQLAFDLLEKEIGIPPIMTGEDMVNSEVPDYLTMGSYLTQIYDSFRGEIPHIKHLKLNVSPKEKMSNLTNSRTPIPYSNNPSKILSDNKIFNVTTKTESKYSSNIIKASSTMGKSKVKKRRKLRPKRTLSKMSNFLCMPPTFKFDSILSRNKFEVYKVVVLKEDADLIALPEDKKSDESEIEKNTETDSTEEFILNFKPVKSLEEYNNNKIALENELKGDGKLSSFDVHFLDYGRGDCIFERSLKSCDYLKSRFSSSSQLNLQYFDENFKEIKSSEFLKNCLNFLENSNKNKTLMVDKSTSSSFTCISNTNPSHIIVRCVEEGTNSVALQELRYCSCSNTIVVDKPMMQKKYCVRTSSENSLDDFSKNQVRTHFENKVHQKRHDNIPELLDLNKFKFFSLSNMSATTETVEPELTYDRIVDWINLSDFKENRETEEDLIDRLTNITSITEAILHKCHNKGIGDTVLTKTLNNMNEESMNCEGVNKDIVEFKTDSLEIMESLVTQNDTQNYTLKKLAIPEETPRFCAINENDETDLSESKEHVVQEMEIKAIKVYSNDSTSAVINRNTNSLRSKRHSDNMSSSVNQSLASERKTKKRKSKYEVGVEERCKRIEEIVANRTDRQNKRREQRRKQTEQFIKSMQMLQSNAKSDSSGPFEDYSIFVYRQTAPQFQDRVKNLEKKFTYVPDRENRLPNQGRSAVGGGADEEFAARIKDLEDKWREPYPSTEKKPKGLMRAIGKIETSDWNIKEIEKKILENKLGKSVNKEKERVPKWNREQFLARQTKLEKLDRQNSAEGKYSELDKGIKRLEQKLKEGSVRDLGQNKVATITERLVPKPAEEEVKPVEKSTIKPNVILPTPNVSEYCHFCQKRVYLMERLSAEGRFFHRGCFKCQYCHVVLRLGSYLFDREGMYGYRFYCSQHFGMMGEIENKTHKKQLQKSTENEKPLEKLKIAPLSGFDGVDLLNRVQTPERIEFANLSAGHISSDHDESLSQMDEDEWTDRNFGASTAEICSSEDEDDSSSLSGTESDNEDAFEEALEEPPTKEGTLRWMERYKQRYSKQCARDDDSESDVYSSSSNHSSYYENSSGDDEDGPVTEDEEEIRARELRKQEVRVEPPVVHTDTGSETEIVSDETTTSSSKHNSATEISTDSEFAVDEPTPTREIPSIIFNDFHVTKTRGNYGPPKRVQVKSGILQTPINGKSQKPGLRLDFTPLVPSPVLSKPAPISLLTRTDGYALNRTQSTGGIATKVSLELKKKYLLGDTGIAGNIQKSGSVSALDSKFKLFQTNITDCQKLLKPSLDINSSPQPAYIKSPLSPIISQSLPLSDQSSKSHDAVSPNIHSVREKEAVPVIDLTLSSDKNNTQQCNQEITSQPEDCDTFKHELEGRPRSPVKEIPIVVPNINWSLVSKHKDTGISSDSLTSDTESDEHSEVRQLPSNTLTNSIPKVEVHNDNGEILHSWDNNIPLDSLNPVSSKSDNKCIVVDDYSKTIVGDKKVLNQPKPLPDLQKVYIHKEQNLIESGHSTPSDHDSFMDPTNAALTETELSDWARDGMVSDDFEDVEFELNPHLANSRKNKKPKSILPKSTLKSVAKAKLEELEDVQHVCGKEKQKSSLAENLNSLLSSLEFMDTGEETSSDEKILMEANLKNNGYVEFQNEDEIIEDSLNPCINEYIETVNPEIRKRIDFDDLSSCDKNTGYCIIGNESYSFGGHVIDLKKDDLQKLKEKQSTCDNEEDSLLMLETGTTTEENTCSDSTVKNLIQTDVNEKKDVDEMVVTETRVLKEKINTDNFEVGEMLEKIEKDTIHEDYQEHFQRLKSKVEFGNAKDSIDIKKSKRKEKLELSSKPDLIQEEGCNLANNNEVFNASLPATPKIIYTKEEVQKSRDENQRLVQEMVMNKMKASNRSLERKKRNRNSFSPNRSFDLKKSSTTDMSIVTLNNENDNKQIFTYSSVSPIHSSPDIITPLKSLEQKEIFNLTDLNKNNENSFDSIDGQDNYSTHVASIKQHPNSFAKQLSVHSSFQVKTTGNKNLSSDTFKTNSEASSLPDIQQALQNEFKTPTVPSRQKNFDIQKSTEKLKQDARARVRLKSNEDLGLSPEEKLKKLREKINRRGKENDHVDVHIQDSIESLVLNTEKRNSLLYSNDTLKKKRNHSFHRSKSGENVLHSKIGNSIDMESKEIYPVRTKSVSELPNSLIIANTEQLLNSKKETKPSFCKSDPNLLTDTYGSTDLKIKKIGIERRKSISKLISDFFGKKKENVKLSGGLTSKGFLSRISPKAKSKSMNNLSGNNADKAKEEVTRTNSLSRISTQYRQVENASPPPIPPLPLNYAGSGVSHLNDDSTDGENDWKHHERSSCDTLNKSDVHRRSSRGSRRGSRQAQLKRHRMAQEIQRKLEETEVKTRELEQRGVVVEKALRGESTDAQNSKEECDLLQQWFDLMRELTELRRYEKELTVRADELELEDRHARLQQQLRDRLDNDGHKTKADVKVESNIISEMMDIVAKRDSLITLLEQDRIRYSEEDHDFEEQMLAKGLRLTSLEKKMDK